MPNVTPPGGGLNQSDILSDGTPFAGSDVGETLSELESGRTRELLLLLQDKPVPEVQDPMNIQNNLSSNQVSSGGDYGIVNQRVVSDFEGGTMSSTGSKYTYTESNTDGDPPTTINGSLLDGDYYAQLDSNNSNEYVYYDRSSPAEISKFSYSTYLPSSDPGSSVFTLQDENYNIVEVQFKAFDSSSGNLTVNIDDHPTSFDFDTRFDVEINVDYDNQTVDVTINGNSKTYNWRDDRASTFSRVGLECSTFSVSDYGKVYFDSIYTYPAFEEAIITDRFSAPITAPADFKQWNAIRAEDVTTGGSTSANPVEFDIGQPDLGSVDRPDDNAAPATSGKFGLLVNFDVEIESLSVEVSSNTSGATTAYVRESDGSRISSEPISGGIAEFDNLGLQPSTDYQIKIDAGGEQYTLGEYDSASYPYSGEIGDIVAGLQDPTEVNGSAYGIKSISVPPINSVRIPQSEIADSAFKLREREYQTSAGSDGQSDFQIATTGDGGHFGISILTVVSVKQNGSVLDSANWSFDPDTDTVTIDTSNVTIASGDTIDIKYDFDVFDSTLQPRAYLNRESTSETSPSISHFRYEYVI
jgi:hypothetical protein